MKNSNKFLIRTGIAIGGLIGALALSAVADTSWTPPSVPPPNGNVSAPINVGSVLQEKAGPLLLDQTFGVLGKMVYSYGSPQTGQVLTAASTSGEVAWKTAPTSGGISFITPQFINGDSGSGSGHSNPAATSTPAPVDTSSYITVPNPKAVIVQVMANSNGNDIFILVRQNSNAPWMTIASAAALSGSDNVRVTEQAIVPLDSNKSFQYEVANPNSTFSWNLYVVGYIY